MQPILESPIHELQSCTNAKHIHTLVITSINGVSRSVTLEHTVHQISQGSPEILAARKVMLIYKQNVMLEAGIQVGLEPEFADNRIVVAVDVGVDAVHPLEHLPNHAREGLGEWDAW